MRSYMPFHKHLVIAFIFYFYFGNTRWSPWHSVYSGKLVPPEGGGDPDKKGGDALRKFRIKPLKETNLGVTQAFFDP